MTAVMFSMMPYVDLLAVGLMAFSLILLWFGRRVHDRNILDFPEDHVTRQFDRKKEKFPYKG